MDRYKDQPHPYWWSARHSCLGHREGCTRWGRGGSFGNVAIADFGWVPLTQTDSHFKKAVQLIRPIVQRQIEMRRKRHKCIDAN